jgi:hypothetical protein
MYVHMYVLMQNNEDAKLCLLMYALVIYCLNLSQRNCSLCKIFSESESNVRILYGNTGLGQTLLFLSGYLLLSNFSMYQLVYFKEQETVN